jgi:hypothetical protein
METWTDILIKEVRSAQDSRPWGCLPLDMMMARIAHLKATILPHLQGPRFAPHRIRLSKANRFSDLVEVLVDAGKPLPPAKPVTLSTGTVIVHRREENGSQSALVQGREHEAMTDAEWDEYSKKCLKYQVS